MNIEQLFESLTPEELKEALNHYKILLNVYNNTKNKTEAVKMMYQWVDNQINKYPDNFKNALTCRGKGCSFCCHIQVVCTMAEAKTIVEYCKQKGISIDKKQIKNQSKIHGDEWIFSAHKKCVFLSDEGGCKVYDVRPIACRLHNAVTPVELCDTDKSRGAEVASYVEAHVYSATTALAESTGIDTMPKLIYKII